MKETMLGSRRDFMLNSASMAAVAPFVMRSGSGFGLQGQNDLQLGIVGTGGRGRDLLTATVKVPGAHVAAICDLNPDAIAKAQAIVTGHQPTVYTYYGDMLEKEKLDGVFVVVPPFLHKSIVVDVLNSGRHCYSEKPLAVTVGELDAIVAASKENKKWVQVGHQLRYREYYRNAMKMIHEGVAGEIGYVSGQRFAGWNGKPSQGKMKWLWSIEESGDQIVEQSVHELDVINWIMNDHPIRMAGLGGQNMLFAPKGNQTTDHYSLSLEYPGGRQASFEMLKYSVKGLGTTAIHAYGTKAGFDVGYSGAPKIYWRDGQAPTEVQGQDVDMDVAAVSSFFDCIRNNQKPFCDVENGRIAALTALMGRKAMYERRVVTWDELLKEGSPETPQK